METNVNSEEARAALAKEYPPKSLVLEPVAVYGFLTVWSMVGWFLAGLLILLRIGSTERIPGLWVFSFFACVALNVVFGTLTARHARRQRKLYAGGKK